MKDVLKEAAQAAKCCMVTSCLSCRIYTISVCNRRLLELLTASGLVEVHVDPFQLQVRVTMVGACWVHAVLVTYHLNTMNHL